jgi:ribosomal protein L14
VTITLPVNTAILNGTGNDPDGTIAAYQWTKIAGPVTGTITNATSAIASANALVQGVYQFELTVTDNNGASAKDTVQVTVNPVAPPSNQAPSVNAGNDVTITLPVNTAALNGSASDPDGTIASYQWVKITGPAAGNIANATSPNATANALIQGIYQFELTVFDNNGATAKDTMQVTVNAAPNQAPTANAGNDVTITLPVNTAALNGTGNDPDGTIAAYQWAKISGPVAGTIAAATSASATANALVQGIYQFELTVTDNSGATAKDTMQVTVNAAPNQAPTANAGNDITITLPVNTAALNGTGNDPDGTIAAYQWTKISGPVAGTIASATSASATANALVQGIYQFELTVTDNSGATAKDTVQVTVNAAIPPNQVPTVYAGNNITITLPVSTASLSGTATDPDGIIAAYQWTKVLGPAAGTIASPTSANTTVNALVQGIYWFELKVTDNNGAIAKDTMQVTVNPAPNQAPSANAGNDITITLPVNTAALNGAGNDPDGTIAAYQWTKISGPAAGTIANATSASATANALVQGIYQFELMVTDNSGATAKDTMQVTVNAAIPPPNQAPTANAGNDVTITLPVNTAALNGTGNDPDGTIAAYQWTKISGPVAGTIANATLASATANALVQGTYQFELKVTDNNGAIAKDTMQVTVNAAIPPPNQAPTANAGNDVTITLPVNTAALNGTGNDPDGTIAAYQWTKISGPVAGTITNATSASATANALVQGIYQFELKVTDNNGAIAKDTMQVTVNAAIPLPNQAPTANAGNDVTITLPVNTAILNGTGNDPDGTIAAYQWTKISGPAAGTIANTALASTTANALVQGIYKFELKVTDNNGATAKDTMQVTVNPAPNQAPAANAGTDKVITLPVNTTTLTGTGYDGDGTITGYQWIKITGPTAGTIANATSANATANALVQGVYQFELTVTDNNGATGKDTMKVTVNPAPNQAPVANAGLDQNMQLPTNATTLNGTGNDPDGTITAYLWTKIAGPSAGTIANPATASTGISGLVQGVYKFELKVTDNSGASDRDTVQVTVNSATPLPNQAPLVNAGLDQNLTLPTNTTTLNGSGSDPDGTITAYLWTKIAGPVAGTITNASAASTGVAGLTQGIYKFVLKVTDNSGAIARDTMQVTVNAAPNQRPVADAGNDIQIYLPVDSTSLSGTGSDADGVIVGYQWNIVSGPAQYLLANGANAQANLGGLQPGIYQAELTVTDNYGATGKDTVTISVGSMRVQPNEGVRIYPNPVQDMLNVEINTSKIDRKIVLAIVDIKGAVIMKKEMTVTQNVQLEQFNMSRYSKGNYFLKVMSDGAKTVSLKILKM